MIKLAKISDFVEKTPLEVEDTDLLAIEDLEDTKKITIATLKEILRPIQENFVKQIVNDTIDRISEKILEAKWDILEYITYQYQINTWIGSDSGNIQISLLDLQKMKWLTREELEELFIVTDDITHKIQVMINHTWETPVSMRILSFNEEHEAAADINKWMADDDAGFLKIHFDNLTANEISRIIYEDIKIEVNTTDEMVKYEFLISRDSFANSVPYTADIPFHCPCCRHDHIHYSHNKEDDTEIENVPVGNELIDSSFNDETSGDE